MSYGLFGSAGIRVSRDKALSDVVRAHFPAAPLPGRRWQSHRVCRAYRAEGFGPHSTVPVDFGCLVAGRDPVAVDATACRMVGLDIEKVAYFEPARDRGLGHYSEDLIDLRGRTIEEVFKPLWLPYLEGVERYPEYEFHTENACSSCMSLVGLTMEKLKSLNEYEKNKDVTIFVGRKKTLPEGLDPHKTMFFGDCLKKYRKEGVFVGGCPPLEPHPLWAIVDRKDYTEMGPGLRERMAKEGPMFDEHIEKLKKTRDEAENKSQKS